MSDNLTAAALWHLTYWAETIQCWTLKCDVVKSRECKRELETEMYLDSNIAIILSPLCVSAQSPRPQIHCPANSSSPVEITGFVLSWSTFLICQVPGQSWSFFLIACRGGGYGAAVECWWEGESELTFIQCHSLSVTCVDTNGNSELISVQFSFICRSKNLIVNYKSRTTTDINIRNTTKTVNKEKTQHKTIKIIFCVLKLFCTVYVKCSIILL
jgi:hypothetical protein